MFKQIRYFFSKNSLRDLTNIISKAQVDIQNLSSNIQTLLQTKKKHNMRWPILKQENLDSVNEFVETSERHNSYVSETCIVVNSEKNRNISLALSNTKETSKNENISLAPSDTKDTSNSVQVCVYFRAFFYIFLFIYYLHYIFLKSSNLHFFCIYFFNIAVNILLWLTPLILF